jgi:LysR family transcriptional regulator, low CO2-responsive transcriptional regulator
MAVTLNQLASFLAVAREGSVSGAARRLYVTQPSISAAISTLSDEVGVDLTRRVGRGIELTPAGEAFRPFAAGILGLVEEGKQSAREAADRSLRRLRIIAVATAGEFLVPSLLRAFSARNPEIRLELEVANRATLFQRLLEHAADVGIAGRPPDDDRVEGRAFMRNEIVLIGATDDPLAASRSVRVEQLADRTWLLREEGSGTRQLVTEFLAAHDLRPSTMTLGSNGAIKEAVQLGLGISLQSRTAVERELAAGMLTRIPLRGLPHREWFVLRPAMANPRDPVRLFVDFLCSANGRRAFAQRQRT